MLLRCGLSLVLLAGVTSYAVAEASKPTISGVVEVAVFANSESESDLETATVELGIAGAIGKYVDYEVVLLHEEGDHADNQDIVIDIATLATKLNDKTTLTLGRQYFAFGTFDSQHISDPLTVALGEGSDTTINVDYALSDKSNWGAYIFSGNTSVERKVKNAGLYFNTVFTAADRPWMLNVGYITDIGEVGVFGDAIAFTADSDRIGGLSVAGSVDVAKWHFALEYLTATTEFDAADLAEDGDGARPSAIMAEAVWSEPTAKIEALAIGVQTSNDATALGLPETVIAVTAHWRIHPEFGFATELHNADYDGDKVTTLTAQLSLEF